MAGVQFAQRMPPQPQGYHQQNQQPHYGGGVPMHPQNNHAPQMHMQPQQQQYPHQQQYMQQNHMGHSQEQMHDQQQYYHDHDRVDAKSAGGEQLIERKMQEIQALRYEVESLQKASDPNQSAARMAELLAQQEDPFNDESEWNMKQKDPCDCCCCIQ